MNILGVRQGHDAGAAIVIDGKVVASIAEERLSRVKNDGSFPILAIAKCLELSDLDSSDIDILALPNVSIPEQYFVFFSLPEKFNKFNPRNKKNRAGIGVPVLPLYKRPIKLSGKCEIHLCEHHRAHAASTYYTSGLNDEETLIVTMDGAGDGVSCAIWKGSLNRITKLESFDTSSSLGWFYSNCTEALGWRHGGGEWKVMGLAPYGEPKPGLFKGYYPEFINGKLIKPRDFGSFGRWNDHGANHYHGRDAEEIVKLLANVSREDFAAEAQSVVEEQAMNLILPWIARDGARNLCCAGGFFLNVKVNQKIWATGILKNQWIYPDCGDSGTPVGAALDAYFSRIPSTSNSKIKNMFLGPSFTNEVIRQTLVDRGLMFHKSKNTAKEAAELLADDKVIAWFQGKMEAGPRALGNRSILMSPLRASNKDLINAKVKYREKFRPFCPSMLYERKETYFENARDEEFMVTSFEVRPEKRDKIPAVVHQDGTARPQLVRKEVNPLYYNLIEEFEKLTGEAVILNTSFNVRGEPVVCTPREAIRCFFDTGIDVLIIGDYVIAKPSQPSQCVA